LSILLEMAERIGGTETPGRRLPSRNHRSAPSELIKRSAFVLNCSIPLPGVWAKLYGMNSSFHK